jgi:pimeloyl-ACP methyl ester carboxylesterase
MNETLRFLHRFARPNPERAREREVLFDVDGESRAATLYLPREPGPRPAWIVLPGVTVPGRHHAGVRRMAWAFTAAGYAVFAPEVPSWAALHVNPRDTEPTIRSALDFLAECPRVDADRVGVMAFSVSATWAITVAAGAPTVGAERPGRRPALRAVAGVGGYGDFRRLVRWMLVGEHEWRGRQWRGRPDPYGRWILGADLLTLLDDDRYGRPEEREQTARALHRLVVTSGRNGAAAWTPVYDQLAEQLSAEVPSGARPAWDLLAVPSGRPAPDPAAGRELADALTEAGLRAYPELNPAGRLDELAVPTILLHGQGDTLVPFSETLRLAAELPPRARRCVTVTNLFAHTKLAEALSWSPPGLAREARRFARTVDVMLRSVGQ